MFLLPKKIGAFTLLRKLGTGGVAESYVGSHDEAGGRPVVVRRILPYVLRDPARLASIGARAQDLVGVRHPFLVHVMDHVVSGDEHFIVEEYVDGVSLEKLLAWCRQAQRTIPHNVFLNIATQVCNGLEALHARPGKGTGADAVLHLGLKPGSIFITRDGKVMVGGYGLTRSPTTLPQGSAAGPVPTRMEYLSPEQTHSDQKLTPASDIFALGAILYELLTLESLFRADSNLATIHKVRRAEVTSQLLRVKELMPGLDKVLYRALSQSPRHRYQRAFVLREDLRGLMSGYSFASIAEDTRSFAEPVLETLVHPTSAVAAAPDAPYGVDNFIDAPETRIDPDPMTTAAITAQALQERAARERQQLLLVTLEDGADGREPTESTNPQPIEIDPPTTLGPADAARPEDRDRPTIPGVEAEPPARPVLLAAPPADLQPERTHYEALLPAMDPPSTTGKVARAGARGAPAAPPPAVVPATTVVPPEADPAPALAARGATAVPTSYPQPRAEIAEPPPRPAAAAPLPPPAQPPVAAAPPPPEPLRSPEPPRVAEAGLPPRHDTVVPPPPRLDPGAPPTLEPVSSSTGPGAANAPPPPSFSRPMPGPSVSRPMPPPTVGATPAVTPVARPVPPAAAPRPVAAAPAAEAPRSPPPAPRAPAPLPPGPYEDVEPEPRGGSGLLVGVAAMVGLGLVAVCTGGAWFGWSWYSSRQAVELAAAPAAMSDDAAAMMADAAPPTVEPTTDPGVDAALAIMAAPVEAPPADTPEPLPPAPEPEPTPAPEPVRSAPAPSPTTSESWSSTPSRTASSGSTSSGGSTRSTSSSGSGSTSRTSSSSPTSYATASSPSSSSTSRSTVYEPPAAASSTYKGSGGTSTSSGTSRTAVAATAPPEEPTALPSLDVSVQEAPVSSLDQYVEDARRGKLAGDAVSTLEGLDLADPQYTRARAVLLMNAQKKGDDAGTKRYLDQLMRLPENTYSPVYLTDYARWYVNHGEYEKAIDRASTAERYWARLPPELVFSKKAEMYEIQAAAWQGKFYKSSGDLELLEKSISEWERYKRHVATRSRTDLAERADTQIAKLNDIRARLE